VGGGGGTVKGGGQLLARASYVGVCLSTCLPACPRATGLPALSTNVVILKGALCRVLCAVPCCAASRALVFVSKFFGGVVPAPCDKGADKAGELGAAVSERLQEYVAAMEKVRGHSLWVWGRGFWGLG
jgi:hypothetical protein